MVPRRYLIELMSCLALYGGALFFSTRVLAHDAARGPWQTMAALLPMLPAVGVCWVIVRQMRRVDELERQLQLEALVFSFALTALLSFSYGFLESVGWPKLSMFWVWGIMAPLWMLGRLAAVRRYR